MRLHHHCVGVWAIVFCSIGMQAKAADCGESHREVFSVSEKNYLQNAVSLQLIVSPVYYIPSTAPFQLAITALKPVTVVVPDDASVELLLCYDGFRGHGGGYVEEYSHGGSGELHAFTDGRGWTEWIVMKREQATAKLEQGESLTANFALSAGPGGATVILRERWQAWPGHYSIYARYEHVLLAQARFELAINNASIDYLFSIRDSAAVSDEERAFARRILANVLKPLIEPGTFYLRGDDLPDLDRYQSWWEQHKQRHSIDNTAIVLDQ